MTRWYSELCRESIHLVHDPWQSWQPKNNKNKAQPKQEQQKKKKKKKRIWTHSFIHPFPSISHPWKICIIFFICINNLFVVFCYKFLYHAPIGIQYYFMFQILSFFHFLLFFVSFFFAVTISHTKRKFPLQFGKSIGKDLLFNMVG